MLSDFLAKNLPARWRKTKFQLMMALVGGYYGVVVTRTQITSIFYM